MTLLVSVNIRWKVVDGRSHRMCVLGEYIMSCLLPISVFLCFLSFLHKEISPSHTSAQLSSGPVKVMIIRQSKIVQGMK